MPPKTGTLRAWMGAALAVDSVAGGSALRLPPTFLCPAIRTVRVRPSCQQAWTAWRPTGPHRRCMSSMVATAPDNTSELPHAEEQADTPAAKPRKLPLQCPGCGAFSQTTHPDEPGFFDLQRRSTMEYMGLVEPGQSRKRDQDRVVEEALSRIDVSALEAQGVNLGGLLRETHERQERQLKKKKHEEAENGNENENESDKQTQPLILCTRCHDLVHHSAGRPIAHPDIDAIRETLAESPYKYNHVYHVLDAADFPMSLLPRIHDLLNTMPLRSRNRRARRERFYKDRTTELSFVVTRSDLLAPRKEQVDRMMPWIRDTLRDALGRMGKHVRLGNVRCVSARRDWWTSELREEIWKNGGATWLVGKANVGKSYLVHHVFPKGRMGDIAATQEAAPFLAFQQTQSGVYQMDPRQNEVEEVAEDLDELALLPPRPAETNYPAMPVVSALPGTTASPIRIPFGRGRGELIDLPGLARTGLTDYVTANHRAELVMKTRVQPVQETLKGPWQSLLLGGLIRITPRTPDVVFLAYNFTPLPEHRTMTAKAIEIQEQKSALQVPNMAEEGAGADMRLAGSFALQYDVTKLRAGPITRKDAVNISVERLPYRVLALDILIEGCGWVEVVAQVRTKDLFPVPREPEPRPAAKNPEFLQTLDLSESWEDAWKDSWEEAEETPQEYNWPVIDVFSPGGKFVGARRPLNAWMLCKPAAKQRGRRSRPRPSMKGVKKLKKAEQRAQS